MVLLLSVLFVSKKGKRAILKTGVSRKQSTPNFLKNEHFLPSDSTRTCAYQGVRNVCFSENLPCFVFLKHPFWDSPFCRITDVFAFFQLIMGLPQDQLFDERAAYVNLMGRNILMLCVITLLRNVSDGFCSYRLYEQWWLFKQGQVLI